MWGGGVGRFLHVVFFPGAFRLIVFYEITISHRGSNVHTLHGNTRLQTYHHHEFSTFLLTWRHPPYLLNQSIVIRPLVSVQFSCKWPQLVKSSTLIFEKLRVPNSHLCKFKTSWVCPQTHLHKIYMARISVIFWWKNWKKKVRYYGALAE